MIGSVRIRLTAMAGHSRLSILAENLLISSLLLSLFFWCSDATGRGVEVMDPRRDASLTSTATMQHMANSCGGRMSCRTTTMSEPDMDMKMDSGLIHRDSIAAAQKKMPSWGGTTESKNSDWMKDSEPERMMDMKSLRNSEIEKEDHKMRESASRMRDSERILREEEMTRNSERMRDLPSKMMDSDTMRDSADGMRDTVRMRDTRRMRESQRFGDSDRKGASEGIRGSQRALRDMEEMREFDRSERSKKDSDTATEPNTLPGDFEKTSSNAVMKSDSTRSDSQRMGEINQLDRIYKDSEGMRDWDRLANSEKKRIEFENMRVDRDIVQSERMHMEGSKGERDSAKFGGIDRMRYLDGMSDSSWLGKSEKTQDSDRMRDSHSTHTTVSHQSKNSEEMRTSDRINARNSEGLSHSDEMRNSDLHMGDSSERWSDPDQTVDMKKTTGLSIENAESSTTGFENMKNSPGSEIMRDRTLDKIRASEGTRDLERIRNSDNMRNSAEWRTYFDNMNRESEIVNDSDRGEDLERMRDINRRGDLESGDFGEMIGSDSNQGSEWMGTDMKGMRDSDLNMRDSDHLIGDKGRQDAYESTVGPSSCHQTNCYRTRDLQRMEAGPSHAEVMHLNSKQSGSTLAPRSCKMKGVDCRVAPDEEFKVGSQELHTFRSGDLRTSACRLNGADCWTSPDRETSRGIQTTETMALSANAGRMSSCTEGHCGKTVTTAEEPIPRTSTLKNSMRRIRNNQDSQWMKSDRTSTITAAERADSRKTAMMAEPEVTTSDSQTMRSTDAEMNIGSMKINSERHPRYSDAEMTTSSMRGSEMVHLTSNHYLSRAEMTDPRMDSKISHSTRNPERDGSQMADTELITTRSTRKLRECNNGANCRATSEVMHMSSRDSEMMGLRYDFDTRHAGAEKLNLERRGLMMDQDKVRESEMMGMESDKSTSLEVMGSDSNMDSTTMAKPEVWKSDRVPSSN